MVHATAYCFQANGDNLELCRGFCTLVLFIDAGATVLSSTILSDDLILAVQILT